MLLLDQCTLFYTLKHILRMHPQATVRAVQELDQVTEAILENCLATIQVVRNVFLYHESWFLTDFINSEVLLVITHFLKLPFLARIIIGTFICNSERSSAEAL